MIKSRQQENKYQKQTVQHLYWSNNRKARYKIVKSTQISKEVTKNRYQGTFEVQLNLKRYDSMVLNTKTPEISLSEIVRLKTRRVLHTINPKNVNL